MPFLPDLLAPLALMLPLGLVAGVQAPAGQDVTGAEMAKEQQPAQMSLSSADRVPGWLPLLQPAQPRTANQVRIERRVIIRISPAPGRTRNTLAPLSTPMRAVPRQFVERPFKGCIDSGAIAGVQPERNRLLFFTRDRQMLSARLENGCSPREFYQGFYMERSKDGKLCPRRDKLLTRSGAKCSVESLHRLVEILPQ